MRTFLFLLLFSIVAMGEEVPVSVASPEPTEVPETNETTQPLPPPLESMRDYWDMYDVSPSTRTSFTDGTAWNEAEENILFFQYQMKVFRLELLDRWCQPESALASLDALSGEELAQRRFDAYRVDGTLEKVAFTPFPEDVAGRYQLRGYYLCELRLTDGREIHLICNRVPRAFADGIDVAKGPYSVGAQAIFIKKGEGNRLYLLADRLAWYPDTVLGRLGMDYGRFDDLDSKPLAPTDTRSRSRDLKLTLQNRECFYQLMYTVGRVPPEEWKKILSDARKNDPKERFEKGTGYHTVAPLFTRPVGERGNFFFLRGTARQIVPIHVEDDDVISRLGISQYYEIFLYTQDSQDNPIVVLTRQLPKEIKPGSGPGYRVDITVPAFFFNTWGYRGVDDKGKPVVRLAPLLMGGRPSLLPPPKPLDLFWFNLLACVVFTFLFVLGISSYFLFTREDRAFRKIRLERQTAGVSLDATSLENVETDAVETDFTHWGEDSIPDPQENEDKKGKG
ncbi:MAG: hypothetical protein Q4D98_12680 [Planctomycetia bacterium]|nr:hypothetical protein [Planctomycetia bacterium]